MTTIELLRSLQAKRDATHHYAQRERELRDDEPEYADIARTAAMGEYENRDDPGTKWCPCPACWRYLTRLDGWHDTFGEPG